MKKILLFIFIFFVQNIFGLELFSWKISGIHKIDNSNYFILQENNGFYRIFIKNGNNISLEYLTGIEDKQTHILFKSGNKSVLLYKDKTKNFKNENNKIIFINKCIIDNDKINEIKDEKNFASFDISKKIEDDSIIVFLNQIAGIDNNYYIGIKTKNNIYKLLILKKSDIDGKIFFQTDDKKIIIQIDWNESGKAVGILKMDNKQYKIESGFFNNTKDQTEME